MDQLINLFKNKPYLAWDLKNKETLSEESMLEHILNYGNWEDYLLAEKVFGIEKAKTIFTVLKNKNPTSLRSRFFDSHCIALRAFILCASCLPVGKASTTLRS